ncbi:MAG: hypothetical protein AAF517_22780 [Planctomycetota bacterium]
MSQERDGQSQGLVIVIGAVIVLGLGALLVPWLLFRSVGMEEVREADLELATPIESTSGTPGWVRGSPELTTDVFRSVGSAPVPNPSAIGPARAQAVADGRSKLRAVVKARIEALGAKWATASGDFIDPATLEAQIDANALLDSDLKDLSSMANAYFYDKETSKIYALITPPNPIQLLSKVMTGLQTQLVGAVEDSKRAKFAKHLEKLAGEELTSFVITDDDE